MNDIEFCKLLGIVVSAKVSKALFYNVVLSLENIQELHKHLSQIWIVSDQKPFQKEVLEKISDGVSFIKTKLGIITIGTKVDMIVCGKADNDVLQFYCSLGSSIIYSMLPILNASTFLKYGLRLISKNILLRKNGFSSNTANTTNSSDNDIVSSPVKQVHKCTFFTVNYNTSNLINLLIRSIHKFVKSFEYNIVVFDNSDKEKLVLDESFDDVIVLDNTQGQLINYEEEFSKYTDVAKYSEKFVGFISMKHCLAVQYGIDSDLTCDNLILCDSDIIIKNDIDFIDESFAAIGLIEKKPTDFDRLSPYLCYINKSHLRAKKISYFNRNFMHGCIDENGNLVKFYDTGTYFLTICIGCSLKIKEVDIYNYCIHFKAQSRTDRSAKKGDFNINEVARTYGLLKSSTEFEFEDETERYSFFIVNYDTSDLVNVLIDSINKNVKSINYDIWIFDNSCYEKLVLADDNKTNVKILDNTKGDFIDYKKQELFNKIRKSKYYLFKQK